MEKKAHLSGVLFAIIFGFTFMMSKIVMDTGILPMGLIAYRFLAAYIVFEILRLTGIVKVKLKKSNILPILAVVTLQPLLYFIFESFGINSTQKSGEAGLMIALIPIIVTILSSLILKEKPRKIQVFFILLSVAGIFVIELFKPGVQFHAEFLGLVMLFFAVMSAAFFNIASRHASKTVSPYELTYFMMLSGAVVFNAIYLTQLAVLGNLKEYYTSLTNTKIILLILYLGIIASIGGFFLVNFTLRHLPAHVSSVYSNIATIVSVTAGAVFLHEKIELYQVIGAAMIILGVYGVAITNYRNKKRIAKMVNQIK